MPNYIIHPFYEVVGSFAWLFLYHKNAEIFKKKYMYQTLQS